VLSSKMAICQDSQVHQKGELVLDVATLHQSVDIALSPIEVVLSGTLRHEIIIVLESGEIPIGEFALFRPDFIADGFAAAALDAKFVM
jgi:hypothetical protein